MGILHQYARPPPKERFNYQTDDDHRWGWAWAVL